MIRWFAVAAVALLCGCAFSSERPLFTSSDGRALFSDGARFEWRENGAASDKRIVMMRRADGKYDIAMIGEDQPLRGAVFVPIAATAEDDFIIQLHITADVEQPAYAFMWAIPGGYRVVGAPGVVDETPEGERALAAECASRPNSECQVTSAAALQRIYRAGIYPRFVAGRTVPGDYIDLVAEQAADKDAR